MAGFMLRPSVLALILTLLAAAAAAQGSGDLPPLPKTKPKTVTKPKTPAKAGNKTATSREPTNIVPIKFNQLTEGSIEAQAAGRIPPQTYYNEYTFAATSADLFDLQLQTTQPNLIVQILDANRGELPLTRDQRTGLFRLGTPDKVLPADGEYRVRVVAQLQAAPTAPLLYSLTVKRTGLTQAGYDKRLGEILTAYDASGARDAELAVTKLEQLAADDPSKATAYEYLGMLYLNHRGDRVKAADALLQAIKKGGAATFKITHDSRWRQPSKARPATGIEWPEQRSDWLKIKEGQLSIVDAATEGQKTLFTLNAAQIKEANKRTPLIIAIKHKIQLKPDTIIFAAKNMAEGEMIAELIKTYVTRKE